MRLRLSELKELDKKLQKIRVDSLGRHEEINRILYHQRLLFVSKIIQTKFISQYHNNPLARYIGINKTKKLIDRKYNWRSFKKDVEVYFKGCNICLGLKMLTNKPYSNLQLLPMLTQQQKYLSINFMTGLSILSNWKGESYDFILVIIHWLIKMKYYEPVKIIINAQELAEVILYVVIQYYGLSNSIVTDKSLFFNSKF